MSSQPQTTELQTYNMLLYRGPVHPEFFNITGRRTTNHADFEFEAWVFKGGHVLRFEHATTTLCEVVTSDSSSLPDRGLVTTLPCSGERDYEEVFGDRISFVTSIQSETLSEHLYLSTYREMLEHGKDPACLTTNWTDEGDRVPAVQRSSSHPNVSPPRRRAHCASHAVDLASRGGCEGRGRRLITAVIMTTHRPRSQ
jgi:hypothetical protein